MNNDLDLRFDVDFDFLNFAGGPTDVPPDSYGAHLTEPAEEFWWENAPRKPRRRLTPGLLAAETRGRQVAWLSRVDLARFTMSHCGPTLAGNISRMLCEALSNAVLTMVAPKRGPGAQIGGPIL
jgi:hypothetical protein